MTSDSEETLESIRGTIQEYDSFQDWTRDTLIGGTVGALAMAIVGFITGVAELLMAPFRAIGTGFTQFFSGTFGAGVGVIDAGGEAAMTSFLDGLAGWFGPLAFPVSVLVVVLAIYILVRGFRHISPFDWLRQAIRDFR